METVEELRSFIEDATRRDYRGRLLDRGEARAIIRRRGHLPIDSPGFAETLDTDLAEYGLSVLRTSLALREQERNAEVSRKGFLSAASAFEALVRNGSPDATERGFWRVMGGSCYHLAGYSAMAYSFIGQRGEQSNFAPGERALVQLLLRDLEGLREASRGWLDAAVNQDRSIAERLNARDADFDDAIQEMLTTTIFRAFAYFEFALATGYAGFQEEAVSLLRTALQVASNYGAVTLWWTIRVALNLIDDLWGSSLHQILPLAGPPRGVDYPRVRELFIASLYARDVAEVELWNSQLDAAIRASQLEDDLVVSLPTSAGKTRIAEICALMSLSTGLRVLVVTPLRALSAQTERSFRRTFGPMGFSVSSLYGASGSMPGDEDALRSREIVIATPEKLDFALRSDPGLINDVGLVVLDEGHLIGPSDRELRYEILVQRLLRRGDADGRRIVCLSAILPDGEQLEDLTAWIRSDADGEAIKSEWRPTRQRFGTLAWMEESARLTFDLDDGPFIHRFVELVAPISPRSTSFPRNNSELTLAGAWRFAEDGKRTLVYCAQRNHVEGYARKIVDLAERGFLKLLLDDPEKIERAESIGAEWLGPDHPAVQCLRVGVAIHHARLPNPFLREVERLLNAGVLIVTVASPTLAQGLNLNASVLLVPSLYRAGKPLKGEEFANVAGRAGRAFVDLEGFVVHVMYDKLQWRRKMWRQLVQSSRARSLESGLVQISSDILYRLARKGRLSQKDAFEYLANSSAAWDIQDDKNAKVSIDELLDRLDSVLLGLVEAMDADTDQLPLLIDEALTGSLWARQVARNAEGVRERQINLFIARSRLIWNNTTPVQRQGHYAMGVGLSGGLRVDAMADELAEYLDSADSAASKGDLEALNDATAHLAARLLSVRPFSPDDPLSYDQLMILRSWLAGQPVHEIGADQMPFIEHAITYRLVWALEALRMRRIAIGWEPETSSGGAAACVESGVPRLTMAMLVRAGLPSREAAIAVVNELRPVFVDVTELVEWLGSDRVGTLTDENGDWPTAETAAIWSQFRHEMLKGGAEPWSREYGLHRVNLDTYESVPTRGRPYRVEVDGEQNTVWVRTPDFQRVVRLSERMIDRKPSVMSATFDEDSRRVRIKRLGRNDGR